MLQACIYLSKVVTSLLEQYLTKQRSTKQDCYKLVRKEIEGCHKVSEQRSTRQGCYKLVRTTFNYKQGCYKLIKKEIEGCHKAVRSTFN